MKKQKMTVRTALAAIMVMAAAAPLCADTIADVVPDLAKYKPHARFHVDAGTVKVDWMADWAARMVLEAGPGRTVRLTIADVEEFVIHDVRTQRRRKIAGDSVAVPIPEDGFVFAVILLGFPDVLLKDYKPRSHFRLPDNTPQRAKYPMVDVHAHLLPPMWKSKKRQTADQRIQVMNAVNVALVIDSPLAMAKCSTGDSYNAFQRKYPERFLTFATIDFTDRHEADFADQAVKKLEEEYEKYHFAGVGETHDKGSGVFGHAMKHDPKGPVYIDDERFFPIWRWLADRKLPILIHTGDPYGFYEPMDQHNDYFLRIQRSPWFYLGGLPVLQNDAIRARRNKLLEAIPDLTVIAAHMDNIPERLDILAQELRTYPNLYTEIGVREDMLARQPRVARKFLMEFQDRVLFGTDGAQAVESYRYQCRIYETDDDAFSTPWGGKDLYLLYGLDLPDVVLKKLYYANAAKIIPGVREALLQYDPDLDFPE